MDQKIEMTCDNIFLEQPTVPSFGESRYLTPLWVSENVEPQEELRVSDPSQPMTVGFKLGAGSLYHQEIFCKIRAALKLLFLREQHVVVQFWSPRSVDKHQVLATKDQPFGLGVASEELCFYRRKSEHKAFLVDEDHEEEDVGPPARVFKQGLPEWTSDLANYTTKAFPLRDCAIRCNLHGYLALPVFDPTTGLCVGVLELLTFSKLKDVAYEVEHIQRKGNLASPQAFKVFDGPTSYVSNEPSQNELDKIFDILKHVCETHKLPLAQTWTLSPSTGYFAHEKVIEGCCSSFNTRCFGKVYMSTTLPFYARDTSMWAFMKASKKCHLEKSRGVAGRALSSRGSCFCGDVTKLDEEEYPLVHYARISRLTSCFAIFLHSVQGNNDYVLEFFLPLNIKDSRHVLDLVQTLKQSIKAASNFELGDESTMEVLRPPTDSSVNKMDSSDLESVVADTSETDFADVADQWSSTNASMETICDNFTVEKGNLSKVHRKRKRDTDTVLSTTRVMVNVTFNKSMKQFPFPLVRGLPKLRRKVAKRFKLEGQGLKLKYIDKDNDLILICLNDDLKSALDASGSKNSINLICSEITLLVGSSITGP
ncbi:hypothetical protein M8C21_014067 [Ambrosia artemisiifolia]|uniref:PB1 domain-containing protein n=1 Tax=Ambrosia artemisiifolia TaxID=4212 RepID=A0AAD5CXQ4_AMBAR|nr:hypothetical protein M8C21_014067 [Ambrosia artemisiifolia]